MVFMTAIKKNIFLTGAPSSGKTTVIKKLISLLNRPVNGFYTEEERLDGKRVGFMMNTIDGKKGHLAHEDIRSEFHIRRYGVSLENIETIAVPSIAPMGNNVIILDEIGKMECFSEAFRRAAVEALDSANIVIGTIALGGDEFILGIKNRSDIEIHEVTSGNRGLLPEFLVHKILELIRSHEG